MEQQERDDFQVLFDKIRAIRASEKRVYAALEQKAHEETMARLKAERQQLALLSAEEMAKKANNPKSIDPKSIEKIIESGTPEERAALVIYDEDSNMAYGTEKKITEGLQKRLQANINKRPKEERNTFLFYIKGYDRLSKYYPRLHNYIKDYQAEVGLLTILVSKWEYYDKEAESCTTLFRAFKELNANFNLNGKKSAADEFYLFSIEYTHKDWTEATLVYDEATLSFKADVDGEGKLYEEILKQAEDTKKSLSKLKAAISVAEDHVFDVADFIMPRKMEDSIKMVKEERYARYYGGPLKYFRSVLNDRKENGETITQDDEKRAVYPDYYEVEPNMGTLRFAKSHLNNIVI